MLRSLLTLPQLRQLSAFTRQGRKEGSVLSPRQPATTQAPGTQDPGQLASNKLYQPATGMTVCKNTCTRGLTRIPFGEKQRNAWNLQPVCLEVSFGVGASGPRHLADMKPHLRPQIKMERTGLKPFQGPSCF